MTNIEYINDSFGNEHVVITSSDGSTISMLKSVWDEKNIYIVEENI